MRRWHGHGRSRHHEYTELLSEAGRMIFYILTSSLSGCRAGPTCQLIGCQFLVEVASLAKPPLAERTRGVKDACSISLTRWE